MHPARSTHRAKAFLLVGCLLLRYGRYYLLSPTVLQVLSLSAYSRRRLLYSPLPTSVAIFVRCAVFSRLYPLYRDLALPRPRFRQHPGFLIALRVHPDFIPICIKHTIRMLALFSFGDRVLAYSMLLHLFHYTSELTK